MTTESDMTPNEVDPVKVSNETPPRRRGSATVGASDGVTAPDDSTRTRLGAAVAQSTADDTPHKGRRRLYATRVDEWVWCVKWQQPVIRAALLVSCPGEPFVRCPGPHEQIVRVRASNDE